MIITEFIKSKASIAPNPEERPDDASGDYILFGIYSDKRSSPGDTINTLVYVNHNGALRVNVIKVRVGREELADGYQLTQGLKKRTEIYALFIKFFEDCYKRLQKPVKPVDDYLDMRVWALYDRKYMDDPHSKLREDDVTMEQLFTAIERAVKAGFNPKR